MVCAADCYTGRYGRLLCRACTLSTFRRCLRSIAKPVSFPKSDATQAFRATAENSSTQAKEAFEKMSAATAEATALIKNSYSTAVKGAQDYNAKVIEFANAVVAECLNRVISSDAESNFLYR
jgi:hypothetical protein